LKRLKTTVKSKYGIIRNALVWDYSFTVSGKHKVSSVQLRPLLEKS